MDPPPKELNGNGDYSSRSPQTPPKRSGSPVVKSDTAVKSTAKLGCYRLLLAPKEAVSPLTEFANRLVKQLTVFGVTGAQIIAHNGAASDANLELKNFVDRYRSLNERLSVESLPMMEKDIDAVLIVFVSEDVFSHPKFQRESNLVCLFQPNSTTTILLTETGTFITCADEGTRLAIKNAILASAPQMVVVPSDGR